LEIVYDGSGKLGVIVDNTNDENNEFLNEHSIQMLSVLQRDASGSYGKSLINVADGFISGVDDIVIIPEDKGFDDRYAKVKNIKRFITNINFNIRNDSPRYHFTEYDIDTYIETDSTFIGSLEIDYRRAPSTDLILTNIDNGRIPFEYNDENREILEKDNRNLVDIIYQDVSDVVLPYNKNLGTVRNNKVIELNNDLMRFDTPIFIDNERLNDPITVLIDNYSDLSFIDKFNISNTGVGFSEIIGSGGDVSIASETSDSGPFVSPVLKVDINAEVLAEINYGPILSPGTIYRVSLDLNSVDLSSVTTNWKVIVSIGGVPFEINYDEVAESGYPIFNNSDSPFVAQALDTDLIIKFVNTNFFREPIAGIFTNPDDIVKDIISRTQWNQNRP
jgi:hypothetical protein